MKSLILKKAQFMGAFIALSMMLTGCYEKDDSVVDVTPVVIPDAVYSISGTVLDAADGSPIAEQKVVLNGGTSTTTDATGFYKFTGLSYGANTLTIDRDGYKTNTRTVYLEQVNKGQTCQIVADIHLFSIAGSTNIDNSTIVVEEGLNASESEVANAKGNATADLAGLYNEDQLIIVDGNIIANKAEEVTPRESLDVTYDELIGYSVVQSTIENNSRALVSEDYITVAKLKLSQLMGAVEGVATKKMTTKLLAPAGTSIVGYTMKKIIAVKTYTIDVTLENVTKTVKLVINNYNGSATIIAPTYDSHDTHDTHDSHDGHGTSAGAGGGSSM